MALSTMAPKFMQKNLEWKTLYSDTASGQNPFGGWKVDGIKEYNRLLTVMLTVREDEDLCLYQEKLAVQRLYAANKEYYEKPGNSNKPAALEEEEEEEIEMVYEPIDL